MRTLLALALGLLTGCREPTSVTLVLSSDVACADLPTTSVTVSRADAETLAPAMVTQVCQPDGRIGTLVVVPAADRDEDLRVRVVTSLQGATCEPGAYGTGCIVSRRQLRFIAHEELTVPIAQQVDCAGVACGATTTCRQGQCVEAQVDQDQCKANPDQCGIEVSPGSSAGGAAGAAGAGGAGTGGINGVELPSIPSNFDTASQLGPTGVPGSGAPDVVGAFRLVCNPSHEGYNDPVVYPGQPGKSPLRQFFGNTRADASSTYESLRTTGDSTCGNALDRSAYVVPAMMNGKGKVVRPDYVQVEYKRLPATSPDCQVQGKACVKLPRGLRLVTGYNMATPDAFTSGYFNCNGPTATSGHYPTLTEAAKNCPVGNQLGAMISTPECWNGKDLDSPDHRSHLAYGSYGDTGVLRCPATHPYLIPTLSLSVWYTTDEDLDRSGTWEPGKPTWSLSSDTDAGVMREPGTTLSAAWFGAWDDDTMATWTEHCINKLLNCSSGDLGDGTGMKLFDGFTWTADPHLVDPPPGP